MVKISVVVPIYDVEEFLEECLDSIINQTFKDIEIICIDDGSTDNSLNILKKYSSFDSRIRVISQENCGHAVATNLGITLSKGKYLFLMDSDDILELTAFEELFYYAEEKNVDFLIFQAMNYIMDEDRYYKSELYSLKKLVNLVGSNIFKYENVKDLIFDIPVTPWSKLYRTEFIKKSGAKFPEGLVFDDNIFFFEILFNAERIVIYEKYLFIRRWYNYSSTTNGDKRFMDSIDINNLTIDLFKKYGVFEEFKKELYNRKVNLGNFRFVRIKDEFKGIYFEKLQNDFKSLVNDGLYEDYVKNLNERNKYIFNSVLDSQTAMEFKYKILYYDLRNKNSNLNKKIYELENIVNDLNKKLQIAEENNKLLKNDLYELNKSKPHKLNIIFINRFLNFFKKLKKQ